jgi:fructose-1-phosphate kinase PfkB-like protein
MSHRLPSRARVAVIGDAMMDVTARIDSDIVYASDTPAGISLQPGGSGANTAAWLGATGVPVAYIGAVGSDAFGAATAAFTARLSGPPVLASSSSMAVASAPCSPTLARTHC